MKTRFSAGGLDRNDRRSRQPNFHASCLRLLLPLLAIGRYDQAAATYRAKLRLERNAFRVVKTANARHVRLSQVAERPRRRQGGERRRWQLAKQILQAQVF